METVSKREKTIGGSSTPAAHFMPQLPVCPIPIPSLLCVYIIGFVVSLLSFSPFPLSPLYIQYYECSFIIRKQKNNSSKMASWTWTALSDQLVEVVCWCCFFTATWICILSIQITEYLTLGKLLRFSEPQFSHSKNGNNSACALRPLWKYLIWCLAHCMLCLFSFFNVIKRIFETLFLSHNIIALKFIVMVLCSGTSLVFTTL